MTPEIHSGSILPDPFGSGSGQSSAAVRTTTDEASIHGIFEVLDDADCRAILEATSEDVLTATEVSEQCGLPRSTTYRKLELLTDAGFLDELTRMRNAGRHPSEYACRVADVVLTFGRPGGLELRISYRETSTEDGSDVLLAGE